MAMKSTPLFYKKPNHKFDYLRFESKLGLGFSCDRGDTLEIMNAFVFLVSNHNVV